MSFVTNTFIRRAERDDLDIVVTWMDAPDFRLFLYGEAARSPKQVREQIIAMLGRPPEYTMPGGVYLIIDAPDTGPIGMLSLRNISWRNRSCSIEIYIGESKIRRRFTTAIAVYRTLEYCFDELNLHRVSAFIYAFNTASWRIFERTGAVRELILRDHVVRNGKCHDAYGYGLLRPEFEALRKRYGQAMEGVSLQAMIEAFADEDTEPSS